MKVLLINLIKNMNLFKRKKPEFSEPKEPGLKAAKDPIRNIYFNDAELRFMQIHSITPEMLIKHEPIIFNEINEQDKAAANSLLKKIPEGLIINITTDENPGENSRSILFKYAKSELDRIRDERNIKKNI
jgi:hypothetical protein